MTETFEPIAPMKAQLSDVTYLREVSNDPDWGAGEKFDGFRECFFLGRTRNELLSAYGNSHIECLPQFQKAIPELAGTILDCEGMAPTRRLEDNASCFKSLPENAIQWQDLYGQATLVAFDVLQYRDQDIRGLTQGRRIQKLDNIVKRLQDAGMPIRAEKLVFEDKLDYYNQIVGRTQEEGHEGVILKLLHAPYQAGKRSDFWLKVKREMEVVAVITGFVDGLGKYEGTVGALEFDLDGVECSAGGMTDQERHHMRDNPELYIGKKAIFAGQEITGKGALRHPRFKGLA